MKFISRRVARKAVTVTFDVFSRRFRENTGHDVYYLFDVPGPVTQAVNLGPRGIEILEPPPFRVKEEGTVIFFPKDAVFILDESFIVRDRRHRLSPTFLTYFSDDYNTGHRKFKHFSTL